MLAIQTAKTRSQDNPVGVYPLGWDHSENPAYYISVDAARVRRKAGAWFSFHHGKDIAQAGECWRPIAEDKKHSGWKVVGQTARFRKHRPPNALGPGLPVWQLAR